MKIVRKRRKQRAAQEVEFPWLKMTDDTPEHEREYIGTLMIGLQSSPDIYTLIAGLTEWLVQVARKERERQGHGRIVVPGMDEFRMN